MHRSGVSRGRCCRRRPGRCRRVYKPPLTQPELVHQAPDVVLIVTDSKVLLDRRGEAAGCPAIVQKTMCRRTLEIHLPDSLHLIGCEATGATGRAPSNHSFEAFVNDGSMPAGRRGAADAVPPCYL